MNLTNKHLAILMDIAFGLECVFTSQDFDVPEPFGASEYSIEQLESMPKPSIQILGKLIYSRYDLQEFLLYIKTASTDELINRYKQNPQMFDFLQNRVPENGETVSV